ncbi:hypothetical protein BFP72_18125 [Reichenbachiella sp. 5M10]|nr:hypothetical protein BFP72_18125 [Reichenbachiella sp. 5M10]
MTLAGCISGEGDPGPAGEDGSDGRNGIDGRDGVDGQNGVGFDELTKFGDVKIYLEGIRPDDEAFQDTSSFKFLPIDRMGEFNVVTKGPELYFFELRRFLSAPDDVYQSSYVDLNFTLTVADPPAFDTLSSIRIYKNVVTHDLKVFEIYDQFMQTNDLQNDILNLSTSDLSYDESTGQVMFKFSFEVEEDNNSTGSGLKVSGEVDAIVFENIGSIERYE